MSIENIASDRLHGVDEIAAFRGEKPRRTRYLIEQGVLPVAREGAVYVASKARLLRDWETLTGVAAEPGQRDDGAAGGGP